MQDCGNCGGHTEFSNNLVIHHHLLSTLPWSFLPFTRFFISKIIAISYLFSLSPFLPLSPLLLLSLFHASVWSRLLKLRFLLDSWWIFLEVLRHFFYKIFVLVYSGSKLRFPSTCQRWVATRTLTNLLLFIVWNNRFWSLLGLRRQLISNSLSENFLGHQFLSLIDIYW